MDLRKTILAEHSRAQANKIVKWVGNSQSRFDQLFLLFLTDEYRVVQRAGWPISDLVIANPAFIKKYFGKLMQKLQHPGDVPGVKRNIIRLLQFVSIPKRFHGTLMNTCFGFIASPSEEAAVKAFSLTVLSNLAKEYPEITVELKAIVEERWDYESAAFKSRSRKLGLNS